MPPLAAARSSTEGVRAITTLLLVAMLASLAPPARQMPRPSVAEAATSVPELFAPTVLYANGAELEWTVVGKYTYYVHRSRTAGFTPSDATRIGSVDATTASASPTYFVDTSTTTASYAATKRFRDAMAGPGRTFYYRIVANGVASNERAVTLPAAGQAIREMQPDPLAGRATYYRSMDRCTNFGKSTRFYVGTLATGVRRALLRFDLSGVPRTATVNSARLTLSYDGQSGVPGNLAVHRPTQEWQEGAQNGVCDAANWNESLPGVVWGSSTAPKPGGAFTSYVWASSTRTSRSVAGSDEYVLTTLARAWVADTYQNYGVLLKATNEALADGKLISYIADDDTASPLRRPRLVVNHSDPDSKVLGPSVSVSAPARGVAVKGTVKITAAASDDHRVEQVEFFVDGARVGTDTAPPWEYAWNTATASNAAHTLTARATDSGGNQATSPGVGVTVDNVAPSTAITSPANQAPPVKVSGTTAIEASASDNLGVDRVEFLFDGKRIAEDRTAPYAASWNTLDPALTAYDGARVLTTKAYDTVGQVTTSAPVTVAVDNTAGTRYRAGFASSAIPAGMRYDPDAAAQQRYGVTVTVTNNSTATWSEADTALHYRWLDAAGAPVAGADGPAVPLGGDLAPGASRQLRVVVQAPALGEGVSTAQYTLRLDLRDTASGAWYAAKGNQPLEKAVQVTKATKTALGLEPYYEYDGQGVGAGMDHLLNVATGNSILRLTPFSAPGRGIDTVVDLTYNGLENGSASPVGNNWSLGISSLSRLGVPLDIHPTAADTEAGNAEKWIGLTDADGTTHRFEGRAAADGSAYYEEPAGVHLYLRPYSSTAHPADKWAVTTPDRVTFYYDAQGYPTGVEDANGNRLTYALEAVPAGQDVGYAKRVVRVTDAGGRSFALSYYDNVHRDDDDDDGDGLLDDGDGDDDDTPTEPALGRLRYIRDHTGSALHFAYYDDGNLLRLTQEGGLEADDSAMASRSWVFTYTNQDGTAAAIPDAARRADPNPSTADQSTRLYSVRDPRGDETIFSYHAPTTGANWWKLLRRTDREGKATTYGYDNTNRVTAKTAPLSRVTRYTHDASGPVTRIANPKGEASTFAWSADRQLTKVTEPSGRFTEASFDANGNVTSTRNQLGDETRYEYESLAADAGDVSGRWKAGRTAGHISQLTARTDPKGVATTGTATDYRTAYAYDARGNLTRQTDPEGNSTAYVPNADGTLQSETDARGIRTAYSNYDANGFPGTITEAAGTARQRVTRQDHDADGLLRWIQDPNHAGDSGEEPREYRTYFDYDGFHRWGRTSTPLSTEHERGRLIWTGVDYDANDNVVSRVHPHYNGSTDDAGGDDSTNLASVDAEDGVPKTRTAYDGMDRPTLVTEPDTSADPAGECTGYLYDDAGRLTRLTTPKGTQTAHSDRDFATHYAYDVLDRVTKATRYAVDGAGAVTKTLNTHNCYQANTGDLLSVTRPNAGLDAVSCDATTGAPSTATHTSRYAYDAAHRNLTAKDAENNQGAVAYDANGNVESATDAGGAKSTVGYDMRNLPTQATQPFDTGRSVTARTAYDAVGNLEQSVSPRGVEAGGGKYATAYQYDELNRPTRVSLPHEGDPAAGHYVHHGYDANGNLTETTQPDAAQSAGTVPAGKKTQLTYYDTGWIRSSRDGHEPRVFYEYTAEGRQSARTVEGNDDDDEDGEHDDTDTDDDGDGLPDYSATGTSDDDDDGDGIGDADDDDEDGDGLRRMTWSYYADGMLRERRDEGGQADAYAYDANDNPTRSTDASGISSSGGEDEDAGSAAGETPVEVDVAYDGLDRAETVTVRKQGAGVRHVTSYAYDRNGNVTAREEDAEERLDAATNTWSRVAAGRKHEFSYTQSDRLATHIDRGPTGAATDDERATYAYDPNGRETGRTVERHDGAGWAARHEASRTYFANGALKGVTAKNGAGTVVEEHALGYLDAAGRYANGHRTKDTYALSIPGSALCSAAARCADTYEYDARDRLARHARSYGSATLDTDTRYTLDATGNVTAEATAKNGATATRSFAYVGNRLTSSSEGGRTEKQYYDPRGNLSCVTLATGTRADCSSAEDGSRSPKLVARYGYDYLDRLAGYRSYTTDGTTSTEKDIADYRYDALDRVARQAEDHPSWSIVRDTIFAYVGLTNRVASERHENGGTGALLRTKAYGYGARGERASLVYTPAGGTPEVYGYLHDPHENVSLLLSASGAVKGSYGYTPYGSTDATLTKGDTSPDNPLNPYRYTGHRYDTGSGTLDMGARRYVRSWGRFLQRDEYKLAGEDLRLGLGSLTGNRYALAAGNPVSYAYPGGREPCNDGTGANAVTQTLNNLCGGVKGFAEAGGEAISGAAEYMWATNPSNPDYQSNMLAMGSNALDFGRRAQADPAGAAQQAWDGYTAPIREDWNAGNRWEAGGRAVFDGVGFLTGGRTLATKAAGTAGKLSGATSLEQRMIRATSVQRSLGPAPSGKVIAETTSGTRTVSGWAGAPGYENGVWSRPTTRESDEFHLQARGCFRSGCARKVLRIVCGSASSGTEARGGRSRVRTHVQTVSRLLQPLRKVSRRATRC